MYKYSTVPGTIVQVLHCMVLKGGLELQVLYFTCTAAQVQKVQVVHQTGCCANKNGRAEWLAFKSNCHEDLKSKVETIELKAEVFDSLL